MVYCLKSTLKISWRRIQYLTITKRHVQSTNITQSIRSLAISVFAASKKPFKCRIILTWFQSLLTKWTIQIQIARNHPRNSWLLMIGHMESRKYSTCIRKKITRLKHYLLPLAFLIGIFMPSVLLTSRSTKWSTWQQYQYWWRPN